MRLRALLRRRGVRRRRRQGGEKTGGGCGVAGTAAGGKWSCRLTDGWMIGGLMIPWMILGEMIGWIADRMIGG